MFDIPILIVTFNRPHLFSLLLEILSEIQPQKVYVAIDGPRQQNKEDKINVDKTITLLDNRVSWKCNLQVLKRNSNLGCRDSPSSAIDWFFTHEEEGIILEDDCHPVKSFFFYCKELLNKYRYDTRIMHIGGYNRFPLKDQQESYYYSKIPGVWGWATWRRAWQHFDISLHNYQYIKKKGLLKNVYHTSFERIYRTRFLEKVVKGKLITCWDYQWDFSIRANNGLCIRPYINMIDNTGFEADATHTQGKTGLIGKEAKDLTFPLTSPSFMVPDHRRDLMYLIKTSLASKFL